ncbi:hypothetical protein DK926_02205 [Rhodococcus sp. Eu-32]|uniref:hypothetical protein n=1 Tax=Rhodococcus sp. Eu-32 TaxID=1017319 RepID=UPI000DF1B7EB|nr:hypothetical protein [Rhodococcus sp. Eu-32]RRQ29699.1 hypothetical protein DK926_02205 [Rhodococcus sp. Eu-32]
MLTVTQELLASDPTVSAEQGAKYIRGYERQDAGTIANWFLSPFIPFTSRDGYMYFVDTRPGPKSGCVTDYAHADTDSRGPVWLSLAAMLESHADALEAGTPIRNFRPTATDGVLRWGLVDNGKHPRAASESHTTWPDDARMKNEARRRLFGG